MATDSSKMGSMSTSGYLEGDYVYFFDSGYMFRVKKGKFGQAYEEQFNNRSSLAFGDYGCLKIKLVQD